MTKEEKKQWILKYMEEHKDEFIDITAENFILAYIDKFNPKLIEWYPYGSPKVHEIGKLLAELYKENKVGRNRHYCKIWQDGYPRWFYIYYLKYQVLKGDKNCILCGVNLLWEDEENS